MPSRPRSSKSWCSFGILVRMSSSGAGRILPLSTTRTRPNCSMRKKRFSPGTCTMASGVFTPVTNGSRRILVWARAGSPARASTNAAESAPPIFASFILNSSRRPRKWGKPVYDRDSLLDDQIVHAAARLFRIFDLGFPPTAQDGIALVEVALVDRRRAEPVRFLHLAALAVSLQGVGVARK